jgi:hypothetical protein
MDGTELVGTGKITPCDKIATGGLTTSIEEAVMSP